MAATRWLDEEETRAWRGFLRLHQVLRAELERELNVDAGLSLSDYEVLVGLSEAEEHRLRMYTLAEQLAWSRSRLSHQVTRMQARGLVRREECPTDARGAFATLTPAGLAAIEAAAPGHLEGVRRHFFDRLTSEQVRSLAELTTSVLGVEPW
ncbi:MAG TPA: MarR family transcriptional regulator [Acidimicrobiales bacterium]|jgi:DNA-binding MarR family transcriptional regulator|nr:MarR family transcriptional regulator [Acidimicrobiales bacterium]